MWAKMDDSSPGGGKSDEWLEKLKPSSLFREPLIKGELAVIVARGTSIFDPELPLCRLCKDFGRDDVLEICSS